MPVPDDDHDRSLAPRPRKLFDVLWVVCKGIRDAATKDWETAVSLGGVLIAANGLALYGRLLGEGASAIDFLAYVQLPDLVLLGLTPFAI